MTSFLHLLKPCKMPSVVPSQSLIRRWPGLISISHNGGASGILSQTPLHHGRVWPQSRFFIELHTATDLVLHATKATTWVINKAISNLVMLEHHLWLNINEIKDLVTFFDFPAYPMGSFSPAIEGFTEHVTAARKSWQPMRHFLPKHSSSVAGSCCKNAPSSGPP